MNNVFRAEMYKLKCNKHFYICLISLAIFNFAISYISGSINDVSTDLRGIIGLMPIYLALSVSNVACNDFDKKTIKNLLSSGNTRAHIYMGKFFTSVMVAVIYFVVDGFFSVVTSYIFKGIGNFNSITVTAESLLLQLGLVILYSMTFFGISMMFKSTKGAYIASILFTVGFSTFVTIFAKKVLKSNSLSTYTIDTLSRNIEALKLSIHMAVNFAVYTILALGLNIIGYLRFKSTEA